MIQSDTKVMKCNARFGSPEYLVKWPCGVSKKGFGSNSIKCNQCSQLIHGRFSDGRFSGVCGKLQNATGFQ